MISKRQQHTVPMEASEMGGDGEFDPALMVERKELQARVQNALNSLEPDEATVILMRDLQDAPYEEVARVLDVPVGTVKSRLHRARQSLRERLAAHVKLKRGKPWIA
jgi:RNA polymerase sigma-70 factor (ECF subfamily)